MMLKSVWKILMWHWTLKKDRFPKVKKGCIFNVKLWFEFQRWNFNVIQSNLFCNLYYFLFVVATYIWIKLFLNLKQRSLSAGIVALDFVQKIAYRYACITMTYRSDKLVTAFWSSMFIWNQLFLRCSVPPNLYRNI